MYSFPLEEEKGIEKDNFSTNQKTDKTSYIQPIPIISGAVLFLVVLLDMILLYIIHIKKFKRIKENYQTQNLKNQTH